MPRPLRDLRLLLLAALAVLGGAAAAFVAVNGGGNGHGVPTQARARPGS
jgi:hypothetical protein